MNEEISSRLIFQNFNQSFINSEFSHCLKQAEVIPVFERKEKLDKFNYRPVRVLPVISKIYERLMYDQIYKSSLNFDAVFVKDLALTTVSYMVESWKESLDPGGHYSAQLTDPSKAFD